MVFQKPVCPSGKWHERRLAMLHYRVPTLGQHTFVVRWYLSHLSAIETKPTPVRLMPTSLSALPLLPAGATAVLC